MTTNDQCNGTYTNSIDDSHSPQSPTNTTQLNTTLSNTTLSNTTLSNSPQPTLTSSLDGGQDNMILELSNSETSSGDTKEEDTKMCVDLKNELDLVLKQYELVTQRMNDLTNENLLLKERIHKVVSIFNKSRKV